MSLFAPFMPPGLLHLAGCWAKGGLGFAAEMGFDFVKIITIEFI